MPERHVPCILVKESLPSNLFFTSHMMQCIVFETHDPTPRFMDNVFRALLCLKDPICIRNAPSSTGRSRCHALKESRPVSHNPQEPINTYLVLIYPIFSCDEGLSCFVPHALQQTLCLALWPWIYQKRL